ncbi:unnamed protein product [Camellia sinensis]
MSHFGRSGPPDIRDTYSLLVLNITFRTSADDLFPLFEKYGKVVDVFIPRDRRTGDSRGFAFVRYKYADEAQKAVEKLDGRVVDGREIMVQFAKYGPNAERIGKRGRGEVAGVRTPNLMKGLHAPHPPSHKGRIIESESKSRGRSRSRSPRPSGIGMSTGIGITGGEVAAEVGVDMTVNGTAEGIEIIVIEAEAAVEVLIITKTVAEADMMMRGAVEVGHMEGHHHLGVEVLMSAIAKYAHLLQRVFHHVVELLILEAHLHVLMLMNEIVICYVMDLWPVFCFVFCV